MWTPLYTEEELLALYNQITEIEVIPVTFDFPTEDYLQSLNRGDLEDQIAFRLKFTQYDDLLGISGMMMEFRNGYPSPTALSSDWFGRSDHDE